MDTKNGQDKKYENCKTATKNVYFLIFAIWFTQLEILKILFIHWNYHTSDQLNKTLRIKICTII